MKKLFTPFELKAVGTHGSGSVLAAKTQWQKSSLAGYSFKRHNQHFMASPGLPERRRLSSRVLHEITS